MDEQSGDKLLREQPPTITQNATALPRNFFELYTLPEVPKFGISFFVDQLIATQIKNPSYFEKVINSLKQGIDVSNFLLSADNPFVAYVRERLETEVAQFGSTGQVIQEAVTNGAEAKKSDNKSVTLNVQISPDNLIIADNGKGMRFGQEFMQILRPHSGEEGKIRGQFGQGTKSYWRLLTNIDSYMIVKSVTESGEFFACKLGYTPDRRRYCQLLDYSDKSDYPSGTHLEFVNCDLGHTDALLEEFKQKTEDLDYADIVCNGEKINKTVTEGKKYAGENGTKIILASDQDSLSSDMQVRINVRGETLWNSDLQKNDQNTDNPRIIIDLSKEAMTAEARTHEHLQLTKEDREAILSAMHLITTDQNLSAKTKARILAVLSRPIAFLQTKNSSNNTRDDITRYLADELTTIINQENLGVTSDLINNYLLDWDQDILRVHPDVAKYLPAEARAKTQVAARGFFGETTLLEVPIKGGIDGPIYVESDGIIYVNQAFLEGLKNEWPIRAAGLNTLIKLRNDIGVDVKPIRGSFNPDTQSAREIKIKEAEKLWPNETVKLDLAQLSSSQSTIDRQQTALNLLETRASQTPTKEQTEAENESKIDPDLRQKVESLLPDQETLKKLVQDYFIERARSSVPNTDDKTNHERNNNELTQLLLGGEEFLKKVINFDRFEELIKERNQDEIEFIPLLHQAWQPIIDSLANSDEEGRLIAKSFEGNFLNPFFDHYDLELFLIVKDGIFRNQTSNWEKDIRNKLKNEMDINSEEEWQARVNRVRAEIDKLIPEQKERFYHHNINLYLRSWKRYLEDYNPETLYKIINYPIIRPFLISIFAKAYAEEGRMSYAKRKLDLEDQRDVKDLSDILINKTSQIAPSYIETYLTPENLDSLQHLFACFNLDENITSVKLENVFIILEYYREKDNLSLTEISHSTDLLRQLQLTIPDYLDARNFKDYRYSRFLPDAVSLQKTGVGKERLNQMSKLFDVLQQRTIDSIFDHEESFFYREQIHNHKEGRNFIRFVLATHLLPYLSQPDDVWLKEITRWLADFDGTEESLKNLSWSSLEPAGTDPSIISSRQEIISRYPQGEKLLRKLSGGFQGNIVTYKRILEVCHYLCDKFPEKNWSDEDFIIKHQNLIRIYSSLSFRDTEIDIDTENEFGFDIADYIRSKNYSPEEAKLLGVENAVNEDWLEGKDIVSKTDYRLSDQAAVFIVGRSSGEELNWNTLIDSLENPSEDLTAIDRQWVQRDLSAAINAQGGGPLRFWQEWRQNSQNASLKLASEQRKAIVSTGFDQQGRRFAQIVDFVGMKPEEALWSLPTVGFTLGDKPHGSLSRFRMGWLTCLTGAGEVRVRTSVGDGRVTYLRFIPIRDKTGKVIDAEVEASVAEEQTGRISEMTWFTAAGIDTWRQGKQLEQFVHDTAKYLKPEELAVYENDKLYTTDYQPNGNSLINKPVVVADTLQGWELRLTNVDQLPLLLQGGFRIGERAPAGFEQAIPSIIRRTLIGHGMTLALAVDNSILLNKSRDRVEKELELIEAKSDLVTALAIRGLAKMIITGQVTTAKEDQIQGKSPLAYDFNKEFLIRSLLHGDEGVLSLLDQLAEGKVPDLSSLRSESDENDRQVLALAVNLPIIKSGVEGMKNFSIVDLLTLRAGASFLLEGSLPDNLSVYEMIKPLIKRENGEIFLSDYALNLILENTLFWNQAKMKAVWAVQQLKPLQEKINSFQEKLAKKLDEFKNLIKPEAEETWWEFLEKRFDQLFSGNKKPSPAKIEMSTLADSYPFIRGPLTAAGGGSISVDEKDNLQIRANADRSSPNKPAKAEKDIKLTSSDLERIARLGAGVLDTFREAIEQGQFQEQAKISPDKFISGRQWIDAGVYPAITHWTAIVLKAVYGQECDPDKDVGFYLDPTGGSAAHAGGGTIAFNLDPRMREEYTSFFLKILQGDYGLLLEKLLVGTIIHESEHVQSNEAEIGETHDLVFKERVYKSFAQLLRLMLERSADGNLKITGIGHKLKERFSATSIQGKEFYARL